MLNRATGGDFGAFAGSCPRLWADYEQSGQKFRGPESYPVPDEILLENRAVGSKRKLRGAIGDVVIRGNGEKGRVGIVTVEERLSGERIQGAWSALP